MFDNATDEYCSYNSSGPACAAGKTACTDYTITASTDTTTATANSLTCSKLRIKTGSACGYTAT